MVAARARPLVDLPPTPPGPGPGQRVEGRSDSGPASRQSIVVDAFPDRELLAGKVAEVTPIPTGLAGPISDVKIYSAVVAIEEGFDALRTGLSAEAHVPDR